MATAIPVLLTKYGRHPEMRTVPQGEHIIMA